MTRPIAVLVLRGLLCGLAVACQAASAQAAPGVDERTVRETNAHYARPLEQLLQVETELKADVGSRRGSREALQAEVPIDVITASQLQATGQTELARALALLVAGFNYPRPSITDGTDHTPPFTLRGLNPDQVLVLINGRRLHQGALLHNNGTIGRGSSGVDLNTIAVRAVERVEVLRDGAAAQYGSDAIAGIVNVILKGYGQTSQASVQWGLTRAGDGRLGHLDLFHSQPLANDGFVNLTLERNARDATNRAGPDALDGGRTNTHFGDASTDDLRAVLNLQVPDGDSTWFAHGLANRRQASAGAFFRRKGDTRNLPALYPQGFLPLIEPRIDDHTLTLGLRTVRANGLHWTFSATHGANDYHFYVNQSLNRSLGAATPTSFDSGALRASQTMLNLDVQRRFGPHHVAAGLEARQERYQIARGDPASYVLGTATDRFPGAQGFSGFSPANEVNASRHNNAAYLDVNYALHDKVLLDAALRAEHYSDFGSTLDGKLALRARPSDDVLLRASASTGFRAPSLSQAHFNTTSSLRNGAAIAQWGLYSVDHPVAIALGASPLKPEKSRHLTLGLVFQPSERLHASVDVFRTDIDDRIMPSGYIASTVAGLSAQAVQTLRQYNVQGASYSTNAIGTGTVGVDLRVGFQQALWPGQRLKLQGAYQRSQTRIDHVNPAPPGLAVNMTDLILDTFTRLTIESGQPQDRWQFDARWSSPSHEFSAVLNRFGAVVSSKGETLYAFRPKWTLDLDWGWQMARGLRLHLGVNNLFDVQPDEWGSTSDALVGSGKVIRYSQYAPFGYNGASAYLRLTLDY